MHKLFKVFANIYFSLAVIIILLFNHGSFFYRHFFSSGPVDYPFPLHPFLFKNIVWAIMALPLGLGLLLIANKFKQSKSEKSKTLKYVFGIFVLLNAVLFIPFLPTTTNDTFEDNILVKYYPGGSPFGFGSINIEKNGTVHLTWVVEPKLLNLSEVELNTLNNIISEGKYSRSKTSLYKVLNEFVYRGIFRGFVDGISPERYLVLKNGKVIQVNPSPELMSFVNKR